MALTVRPATIGDLAEVDALLARSYPRLLKPDYPPSVLVTALPLISRAQPSLLRSGTYYVAEEAGRIVGSGGWTRDRRQRELGHVRHVITDASVVRRGVGRRVLGHALGVASDGGIRRMACAATRTAVPFYAALGFEELGPMSVDLAPGISFPAVRMTLDLSSVAQSR